MTKIGIAMLGISAVFGLWGAGAEARTLPNDIVRVIKAADDGLVWTTYTKPFSQLNFDAKTIQRIKAFENKRAVYETNAMDRYRLTNVRIVADQVQSLIFRTEYGDTSQLELDGPNPDAGCFLTFSGNGFSRCIP